MGKTDAYVYTLVDFSDTRGNPIVCITDNLDGARRLLKAIKEDDRLLELHNWIVTGKQ